MSTGATGLLIVNADDLGLQPQHTDAILGCFERGAITSATAMVWMRDSARAAELAHAAGLPVGLHLNLIEPFDAPDVPAPVAATQLRVVEHLRSRRLDAQLYHPTWSSDFEHCITDQLTAFEQLYGHPPSHVDGHQHLHLAFNALFARALASVKRLRRPVNRTRNESRASRRLGRAILARAMRVRYVTTDWCFSIRALDPGLGGTGVAGKLALARQASVEVFVHPGWEDELAVLGSPAWRAALAEYSVGSFLDLAVDGRVS